MWTQMWRCHSKRHFFRAPGTRREWDEYRGRRSDAPNESRHLLRLASLEERPSLAEVVHRSLDGGCAETNASLLSFRLRNSQMSSLRERAATLAWEGGGSSVVEARRPFHQAICTSTRWQRTNLAPKPPHHSPLLAPSGDELTLGGLLLRDFRLARRLRLLEEPEDELSLVSPAASNRRSARWMRAE